MSTHELREALESHATFDDTAALARLGSVKARVRAVRRRRRAALAVAAAAVVATAGGLATYLPGGDGDANRQFAGMTAPATMTSLGYTYTFDRMGTGTGLATFIDDMEGPILITWADAGDGVIKVLNPEDESATMTSRGDFSDFVVVGANEERNLNLEGDGELGFAVYKLTGQAEGATVETDGVKMTLRDDIGSAQAIANTWGNEGDTELTLTFAYPERTLVVRDFCNGPKGYDVHVTVGGSERVSSECNSERHPDGPGDLSSFTDGVNHPDGTLFKAGDEMTVRLWVSREKSDEPITGKIPGMRLGLAIYEETPAVAKIGTWNLTEYREEGGHRYRFVSVKESEPDAHGMSLTRTAADRPLLFLLTGGNGDGWTKTFVDGKEAARHESFTGGGAFLSAVGPFGPGEHTLELRTKNPSKSAIAVYERVD